jgi:EAL domain-containing protein (putative c-di-GMP-specific phosphodiesterase class I)
MTDIHSRGFIVLANPISLEQATTATDNAAGGAMGLAAAPAAAAPMEAPRAMATQTVEKSTGGRGAEANTPIAVRSDFNPLANWSPAVPTDAQGHASITVKVPDNLTRYRVMVVAVAGGEDAQFQALLRMRDADGTLMQAGVLVPAAEAAGLMPEIDRWVLAQAIERLHRRHEAQRGLRLFVTQSSRSLADESHAQWLLQQLASQEIADGSLVIDLRLDDALVHPDMLLKFCDTLRPAGVQFCLSQFLHGFEADAVLQQLPLRYMRLSPRYAGARADPALSERLRGVIDNAHRLGLLVIGPQVEEPQGAATLWMSGIDLIQGNLVQQADGNLDFDFTHAVL